ncbi:MAG: porin [Wenzhouxiangella sp.]
MKSQSKLKISSLVGAMALAGAVTLPTMVMADEPTNSFSVFLRMQAELVDASGDIPEAAGNNGLNFGDGWVNGRSDAAGWGGLFIDGSVGISEDLAAVGRYSMNIDMDGYNNVDRDVFIGLRSKSFGQVTVGRHHTPYKLSTLGWDPFNATFMQARANQGRSGTAFGHNSFLNDSINYQHSFSGVRVAAMIGVDDSSDPVTGDNGGDHLFAFSVAAPVGPVELVASYIDASEYRGRADDSTGVKLGARYSEGAFTLAGHYEMRDEGLEDGDFVFLTGSYKMGKWTHSVNFGQFMDDRDGRDNDGDYFAIGTRYSLGRIASIHLGYKRTDRDIEGDDNVFGIGMRFGLNTGNLLAR